MSLQACRSYILILKRIDHYKYYLTVLILKLPIGKSYLSYFNTKTINHIFMHSLQYQGDQSVFYIFHVIICNSSLDMPPEIIKSLFIIEHDHI